MVLTWRRAILWLAAVAVLTALLFWRPAPAAAYEVKSAHPRIWLTPTVLAGLKERHATGELRWAAFKRQCDTLLTSTSPYDVSVQNYALLYAVTGETRYADKAIALMQAAVAKGLDAVTYDAGYGARTVLPAMAVGYDWCYDRMTADQRTRFRTQMEAWADWVWPETNPARASGWGVTLIGNNYYSGFMMTWMIGLALHGDSPKATGYIDAARDRWLTKLRPHLERFGGGYMLEGTNYGTGSVFRICELLAAHATATGEEFLTAPGFNWPRETVLAKIHLTTPDRKRLYLGGDQSRVSSAPLFDADRESMVALLTVGGVGDQIAGYGRHWLDTISLAQVVTRAERWVEALWYPLDTASIDYTKELPPGYLAHGAGLALLRSSWDTDAAYLTFQCGPATRDAEDHQDLNQGEFTLWKGGWLVAPARLNSSSGLYRATEHHSTLRIGGQGQPAVRPEYPKDKPEMTRFVDTDSYSYVEGEAKDAYATAATAPLTQFRRGLLFLKPGKVIVVDRVAAVDAMAPKLWTLHCPADLVEEVDRWRETAGTSAMTWTPVYPVGLPVQKLAVNLGASGARSSWKLEATAPLGNKLDTFCSVLEVGDVGFLPATTRRVAMGRESAAGVLVGDTLALWEFAAAPQPMTFESSARDHYLIAPPGTRYRLVAKKVDGTERIEAELPTSALGVLTWSLPAATWSVTISPIVQ